VKLILSGEIRDGKTIIGVLWFKEQMGFQGPAMKAPRCSV
jgi:hypothetical protein